MKSWTQTIGFFASLLGISLLVGVIYWWTLRDGKPSADAEIHIRTKVHTGHIGPPEAFLPGLVDRHHRSVSALQSLNIESIHPEIVKNDMGLMIGIPIDGRTVDGRSAAENLLVDSEDIASDNPGTARWIMSCSLSGRIADFEAKCARTDKLGGRMTSLLTTEKINTHFRAFDMMVDARSRDNIAKFLAKEGEVYRVYKSDLTRSDATDPLTDSTIDNTGDVLQINTPSTTGFMFVRLDHPFNGTMLIESAIRPDGRRIKAANVWFSKSLPSPRQ